jgi:hypothetical protein
LPLQPQPPNWRFNKITELFGQPTEFDIIKILSRKINSKDSWGKFPCFKAIIFIS